jgi:hypothetical protein
MSASAKHGIFQNKYIGNHFAVKQLPIFLIRQSGAAPSKRQIAQRRRHASAMEETRISGRLTGETSTSGESWQL